MAEENPFLNTVDDLENPFLNTVDTEEESDQTVIGSIARGAGAGVVDIAQGIAELGASGLVGCLKQTRHGEL